jgi:hypothetical protein
MTNAKLKSDRVIDDFHVCSALYDSKIFLQTSYKLQPVGDIITTGRVNP